MIGRLLFGIVILALSASQSAAAQTLREAVEGAWALNPQIKALEARRNEFIARREAARAFFPAPPAITLSHATDQPIQNRNQRVTEAELSAPLWLPGERTATQQVAVADLARTDAQLAQARLAVAGAVRGAVYKFALAERESELSDRRVGNARALETDVARRVRAGEVAALELDQARSELFEAQANARERQARLAAARTALLSLTGLRAPPQSFEEPLAPERDISDHPLLQADARGIDAATAALQLVDTARRESPEIGLFVGRNRDTFGTQYDTTVGLRFRLPFSTRARNAPRQAAALADLAAAQARYDDDARKLRVEFATAKVVLAAAEAETPLVRARLQAVRSSVSRLQGAYDAGQIGLIELIRARVALFQAELALARNRLAIGQARALVNQALGVVP